MGFVWAPVSLGTWETLRHTKIQLIGLQGLLITVHIDCFFYIYVAYEGLGRTAEVRLWGSCVYGVTGRGGHPIEAYVHNLIKVMDCGKCKMRLVRR